MAGYKKANIKEKIRKKSIYLIINIIMILVLFNIIGWGSEEKKNKRVEDRGITETLNEIFKLESDRDPKCHATATRLENFISGTNLSPKARFLKTKLQKQLLYNVWTNVTQNYKQKNNKKPMILCFKDEINRIIPYTRIKNGNFKVVLPKPLIITKRDFEQYSSVAYTLRVILSLQQDMFLQSSVSLVHLEGESIKELKKFLEIVTLSVIQLADKKAREDNSYIISAENFNNVWKNFLKLNNSEILKIASNSIVNKTSHAPGNQKFFLLKKIIEKKVKSYSSYNKISMKVFLRNLQVFFSRLPWPKDPLEGKRFKDTYTELMIDFAYKNLRKAETFAREKGEPYIRENDIEELWKTSTPFVVNQYEDIIFFPKLSQEKKIIIESYDCDAFRDSGIHWKYLQFVLDDHINELSIELDPFAAELFVEGISQYGVLLLRISGIIAKQKGMKQLSTEHLGLAAKKILELVQENNRALDIKKKKAELFSSKGYTTSKNKTFFSELTTQSGINFSHRSSDWLSRLLRSYLKKSKNVGTLNIPPAFGGSGIAAGDLNQDGITDVLILSGSGNSIFWGIGKGKFKKAENMGILNIKRNKASFGEPRQPIIADFNNDGLQDVFITFVNENHLLLKNIGNGKFENISIESGLGGRGLVGGPAVVFDFDRDGLLDIYICYFGDYIHGVLPHLSRKNLNGLPNKLFRNKGNFKFEDVTIKSNTGNSGWGQAATHTDLDNDGWQDLIVGNDFGVNAYYRNKGDGTFENITTKLGLDKPSFTMNVSTTDLNRDGFPDVYISNIVTMVKDEKYVLPTEKTKMRFNPEKLSTMRVIAANDLFISQTNKNNLQGYILSEKVGRGFSSTGWAWGAEFLDFDNDGDDDLYCVNGMNEYSVYSDTPYYKKIFKKTQKISLPVYEKESNVFFVNEGGILNNRSKASGTDFHGNSRSIVYLDFDNDGDLDIILNNYHSKALVYQNNMELTNNNWIKITLKGNPGLKCNLDAIGARVYLKDDDRLLNMREIQGGHSYLSMAPKTIHFGTGKKKHVDIIVKWPNGQSSHFNNVDVNNHYLIKLKPEKTSMEKQK